MKKRIAFSVGILVLAAALFAAVLGSSVAVSKAAPAKKATVVKIGQIVDLTGPESAVGKKQQKSMAYAISKLGKFGNLEVQVVVGDAVGSPQGAQDQATKMITQDKVVAIFGPTQISQKTAVAAVCKKYKVPLFLYNATPPSLFKNPYVIGSGGSTNQTPSAMGAYIVSKKVKNISTIAQKESAGRSFIDPLTKYFKAHGGKVLDQKWVPTGTSDYSPYVTTIKQAQRLVGWLAGSDAIAFWNAYYQSGRYKAMPVVGAFHGGFTDGFVSMGLQKPVAEAFLGVPSSMVYSPDSTTALNTAFVAGYKAMFGTPPGDDAESGPYQAFLAFKGAVQKAKGSTKAAAILAAIKLVKINGPEGPMSFSGHNCATKNVYVLKTVSTGAPAGPKWKFATVKTYKNVTPDGLK
jgi:branched-chain amino acid transport system substrate-binding protein